MNSLLVLDASPLCAMTFKEHVDHDLIITLKKTSTIHKIGDKAKLTKLEARFPHNQPYISTQYRTSKDLINHLGRLYPTTPSSFFQRWALRNTILFTDHIEIDITNCHPNIARQIAEKEGIELNELGHYCDDREHFRTIIINDYLINTIDYQERKKIAKQLMLKLMFGGGFKSWRDEFTTSLNDPLMNEPMWVKLFKMDLKNLRDVVIAKNKSIYKAYVKKKTEAGGFGRAGPEASFLAQFLQHKERRILEQIVIGLQNDGKIDEDPYAVLMHDGIFLNQEKLTDHFDLEVLEEHIKNSLGFIIKLAVKEWGDGATDGEVSNYYESVKEFIGLNPSIKERSKFNEEFFNTLDNFYKHKYFNLFHAEIIYPKLQYAVQDFKAQWNKDHYIYIPHTWFKDRQDFKDTYATLNVIHWNKKQKKWEEQSFINEWFKLTGKRKFGTFNFVPYNGVYDPLQNKNETYNTFGGYSPNIHTPIEDKDYLKGWLKVGKYLCENNDTYFNFLLNSLAHIIQYPSTRLPYMIILKGREGTGKTQFFLPFKYLLGSNHFKQTANANDIFKNHSTTLENTLMLILNEATSKDTRGVEGRLKSLVTDDTISIDKKYKAIYECNLFFMTFVTTNKLYSVSLDGENGERRALAFEGNAEMSHVKYSPIWGKLIQEWSTPQFTSALYTFLNNRPIDQYNFKAERLKCLTPLYYTMLRNSIHPVYLFLEHLLVENHKPFKCPNYFSTITAEVQQRHQKRWKKSSQYRLKDIGVWDDCVRYTYNELFNKEYKEWEREYRPNSNNANGFKANHRTFTAKLFEKCDKYFIKGRSSSTYLEFNPRELYEHLIRLNFIRDDTYEFKADMNNFNIVNREDVVDHSLFF
tara:strand:+ start:10 stop:2601 length:2592 start_codon:yes stop_codon:yes gene_type:complete